MRSDWRELPFEEAIDFQEGPGILAKDFRPSGVPLVRLAGLGPGASVLDGCDFLDSAMVERRWSHFRLKKGDILLSTSASLGRIAIADDSAEGAIPYTGIIRMRPRAKGLDAPFIKYLLESSHFQRQVEAAGVGSVIRHFGPMHLRQMTVLLPPPPEQRAIAAVLGSLDDKIDLNRRMNATLEAIARSIFKTWFIDFEALPVEAARREPVAMVAEAPVQFGRQPLRSDLPRGWSSTSLDQIAEFRNGLALQKYPAVDGEPRLPVIKIAQMRTGRPSEDEFAAGSLDPAYVVDDGDVLFSWSGSLEVCLWTGGRGALNQHLFRVTSDRTPKWLYLLWTRHHLPAFQDIAANKATTMGHIQRHHLSEAEVLVPPPSVMASMSRILSPIIEEQVRLGVETRALEETRDTLLPKLLSGEVRVKDVA